MPASELAVALAGAGEVFDASTMQFDFFKRLLGGFGRPHPREAAPVKLAPQVAAEPADPLLAEARALLRTAGAPALAERVRVEWNARMRSTAGLAFPGRSLVRLNPRLREFGDAEIQRTLRHELAHLLAHERAGRRRIAPHGAEWRRACRDLGLPDEKRTHDLPLPRRVIARRHHYRCPACGVTVARVQPMRRGSACLRCCRAHSRGRYDARFRFERIEPPRAV
ncbi:MAG: SprT-like domain-containing protein [Chthoniobacteraceae bacterium]